jgi:hypothetical protein
MIDTLVKLEHSKWESTWECWDLLPCIFPHLLECVWGLRHFFGLLPFSCFNQCFCVYGLGFTLYINVNVIITFIYIQCNCKCIRFIYVRVSENVKHKMCMCKCKSMSFCLCCWGALFGLYCFLVTGQSLWEHMKQFGMNLMGKIYF